MLRFWSIAIAATVMSASMAAGVSSVNAADSSPHLVANRAYRLTVTLGDGAVYLRLDDLLSGKCVADGPCLYHAVARAVENRTGAASDQLESPSITADNKMLIIRGRLSGLEIEHRFTLPDDRPVMEERIVVKNTGKEQISLTDFEVGLQRRVAGADGKVLADLAVDRLVAVPFRHRAVDKKGESRDYALQEVVDRPGYEVYMDAHLKYTEPPSRHRASEGWAWTRGEYTLGIFKFCQENIQFSVVSTHRAPDGVWLRFGGAAMTSGEPAALTRIAPGETVDLGLVRYQTLRGGYTEAMYAYRAMLDEIGCRFPKDFNPPVHWEQLYDMDEAWNDRLHRYTKQIVEKEAAKGRAYHCEALYLDPGWDTHFGSFLWGQDWLGPRKQFVEEMQSKYGLKVSLHCPLATWISSEIYQMGPSAIEGFPAEARRTPPKPGAKAAGTAEKTPAGKPPAADKSKWPILCLGSKQYLAAAEERMLANCADGVAFLMFDGNWWNGGCDNPHHGHSVPYRIEDHVRANLDLAQRIHAKYPKVLIEMHDPIGGGNPARPTPIYYKYGLPGSYDENWGFELMWDPMADIVEGRAAALYYANMGCNVPIYTHVTLTKDNRHCLILWWFASTCRHLGIGGTNPDPKIVAAQQEAMQWYRAHDRFYKRGEFFGLGEEIHLHVLPDENAFTVNVFNLSDKPKTVRGSIDLKTLGLDPAVKYASKEGVGRVEGGRYMVEIELPPWGTKVGTLGR